MTRLEVRVGYCSERGVKPVNQDFVGSLVPPPHQIAMKGIALAVADGISSSDVSQVASETAVRSFLDDYFHTSEAWSVNKSVQTVLKASNSWLYSQSRQGSHRFDLNKGYVCTFSAVVLKATTAHLFHIGDTRIYRLRDGLLELFTEDHRVTVSPDQSHLARALGAGVIAEIDHNELPIARGDIFLIATDGVYEHFSSEGLMTALKARPDDLDAVCRLVVTEALSAGSEDNASLLMVQVTDLPDETPEEIHERATKLPLPPPLSLREPFDGYRILREIHSTNRSHVYLAEDIDSGSRVVLKTPSQDLQEEPDYLEHFLMEEWIARRLDHPHLVKAGVPGRKRNYVYTALEYVEGQTLAQWLNDNPEPSLETVRKLVEQVARGLAALHRREILHQDIRPENVMIDHSGTVKLIDFGAARVAGIVEAIPRAETTEFPGTALYMAPEYFLGEIGTVRSEIYSLGVLTYRMLSGRFPYDNQVAKARSVAAQRRLNYRSVLAEEREIPVWVDGALKKAVNPNPEKRYAVLSEFLYDLRQPNPDFLKEKKAPLMEQHPVAFWQGVSAILGAIVIYLLAR